MKTQSKEKSLGGLRQYSLMAALVIICVFFHFLTQGAMLTPLNITNILLQNSYVIILAIGMLFIIICGSFDMSVGSGVGLIGAVAGTLCVTNGFDPIVTIIICVAVGLLLGVWNGFLVAYMNIPAFVVTLGSQLLFKGLMLVVMGSSSIGPFPSIYSAISLEYIADPFAMDGFNMLCLIVGIICAAIFAVISIRGERQKVKYGLQSSSKAALAGKIALIAAIIILFSVVLAVHKGIPYILVLIVILVLIYSFIGNNTALGRRIYAVGGNEKAAALSGIKTRNILFFTFANMGVLTGVAGVVYSARLNFATPTAGEGFELDAIAACFIGAASPSGGIGTIRGAITGALIMGVLNNGMSLMGLGVDVQKIVKGLVLIFAVLLDVMSRAKQATK